MIEATTGEYRLPIVFEKHHLGLKMCVPYDEMSVNGSIIGEV